jgi:hypothetical protein
MGKRLALLGTAAALVALAVGVVQPVSQDSGIYIFHLRD